MYLRNTVLYFKNKAVEKNINVERITLLATMHIFSIIGVFIIDNINFKTIFYHSIIHFLSMLSITGGYHRLWSHRSYCARLPLQIFYIIFGTTASQKSAILWAQEHRTHHRCEENEGDPYNINKGFFHAHIAWIYTNKTDKELLEFNKTDVEDLHNNPLLRLQNKFYFYLWTLLNVFGNFYILKLWNETFLNIIFSSIIRIAYTLNTTWSVNSFAHYYGEKTNRKDIRASDNAFIALLTLGEGWHNYHHSYPKDYRASRKDDFNVTTSFINLTKRLGFSYSHHIKGNDEIDVNNRFNKEHYIKLN